MKWGRTSDAVCKRWPSGPCGDRSSFQGDRTSGDAASAHLPDDEAVAVHVGHDVGLEVVLVEAVVQNLWGHVAPGSDPAAQRDVHLAGVAIATQVTV